MSFRRFHESDQVVLSPPSRNYVPRITARDMSPRESITDEYGRIPQLRRDSISGGAGARHIAPVSPGYRRALAQRVQQFRRHLLEDGGLLGGTQRGAVTFAKSRYLESASSDSQPSALHYSGVFDEVSGGVTSRIRADQAVDVTFGSVAITSSEIAIDDNSLAAFSDGALSHELGDNLFTHRVDTAREEEIVIVGEDFEVRSQGDMCPVCFEEVVTAVCQNTRKVESGAGDLTGFVETVTLR